MQAPQAPIDIKIVLGSDQGTQNLINIDWSLSGNQEQNKMLLAEKKITADLTKQALLFFDLYVEPGKQKQAVEFFNQEDGKSPLQIVFKERPDDDDQTKKFSIEEHQDFIRICYRFIFDTNEEQFKVFTNLQQAFENSGVNLESHINLQLGGSVSHNKKNRANVKVNYAKFHLTSNSFSLQNFINSISAVDGLNSDLEDISGDLGPFFELIKKARMIKGHVKLDSFRKINKYYNDMSHPQKQAQSKEFKYINNGIFRRKAQANFAFLNYNIKAVGIYEGEDVFTRLIKVYSKFFEKLLDSTFYDD